MEDEFARLRQREKNRTARFNRLEAMVICQGLETQRDGPPDDATGFLFVKGVTISYIHALLPEQIKNTKDLPKLLGAREDILTSMKWPSPWPDHEHWKAEDDREDEDDRYCYWHYARNLETGERRDIDASSNTPFLTPSEFHLHLLLGCPGRGTLGLNGPIRLEHLNNWIFGPSGAYKTVD